MSPKLFLDVIEVAELLHTSPAYVRKLCFERKIPFTKPFGGKILFDAKEIEDFVRSHRVSTKKELNDKAIELLNRGAK
mgnify:CR=1 FL=1